MSTDPVAVAASADRAAADARQHGCRLVAMVPRGGQPYGECDLAGRIAILVGSEGAGIDRSLIDTADIRLTIPMAPPVESLNAAVAAAVGHFLPAHGKFLGLAAIAAVGVIYLGALLLTGELGAADRAKFARILRRR